LENSDPFPDLIPIEKPEKPKESLEGQEEDPN